MSKEIRKSSGTSEPFSHQKIRESVYKAAKVSGENNVALADEIAQIVSKWIKDKKDLCTEEVRNIVVRLLNETGYQQIAQRYDHYRGKKRIFGQRESLEKLFPDDSIMIDSLTKGESSPWDKNRIAVALVRETIIDKDVAFEIATATEERIRALRLGRISTGLVRELVNHELLLRGYNHQLSNQSVLGIPKYDIKERISAGDAKQVEAWVAQSVLRQYSLQEILSSDCANAHLEGDIFVHGLESPLSAYGEKNQTALISKESIDNALKGNRLVVLCGVGEAGEIGSHVTINLPRIYYRSKENLYTSISRVAKLAAKAIKQRNELITRSKGIISCLGLNELIVLMHGRELHEDEEAVNAGRNIMLYIYFTIKSEDSNIQLSDEIAPEVSTRFSHQDARLFNSKFLNYSHGFHSKCSLDNSLILTKKFDPIVENAALVVYRDSGSYDTALLYDQCQRERIKKLVII